MIGPPDTLAEVMAVIPAFNEEASIGVVVSADFNPKLDIKATEDRRAELAQRKVKLVDPTTPATDAKGAWVHSQLREGDVFLANPVS